MTDSVSPTPNNDDFSSVFDTPVEISGENPRPADEKQPIDPKEPADAAEKPPLGDKQLAHDGDGNQDDGADGDTADTDDDSGLENEEDDADKRPQRRKRTTAERIRRLNADRRYWEQEAVSMRAQVAAIRAELEAAKKNSPLTSPENQNTSSIAQAPDPANYRYGELDPQFIQDTMRHTALVAVAELQEKTRRESEEQAKKDAEARESARIREAIEKVSVEGQSKFRDFEEVVVEAGYAGEYALTESMFEAVLETEKPADILYYLASHPEESARIASLSPHKQALWIGRLEAKLASPAPKPRKVPSAPEPAEMARGAASRVDVPDDTEDLAAFSRKFFASR